MEKKIVTCASYGGTGSSVITDLLKEFSNIKSTGDFEVSIAHEYGGISDLQHYIVDDFHRLKNDEALYNFKKLVQRIEPDYNKLFANKFSNIAEQYIASLTVEEWQGYWHQHTYRFTGIDKFVKYDFNMLLEKIKYKFLKHKYEYEFVPKQKKDTMYLTINDDTFYSKTRMFFNELISTLDEKKEFEYIAIDQMVPPTNISRYLKYFENMKVIIVDRDPRDLYLLNKLYWKEGWIPTDKVETYISWFNNIRSNRDEGDNILRINFEDFICDYDKTVSKIIEFLQLDESKHINKYMYFNPEKSKKNYQFYKRNEILSNELKQDLSKIEDKLYEFIIN